MKKELFKKALMTALALWMTSSVLYAEKIHLTDDTWTNEALPSQNSDDLAVFEVTDLVYTTITDTYVASTYYNSDDNQVSRMKGNGVRFVNYATSSDARLKTKIDDFTGGLELVSQMRVRKYEFIDYPGNELVGFLAQELQSVFPEAVIGDPEGDVTEDPMGVDYGRVTPALVSAIQELKAENEALKAEMREIKQVFWFIGGLYKEQ